MNGVRLDQQQCEFRHDSATWIFRTWWEAETPTKPAAIFFDVGNGGQVPSRQLSDHGEVARYPTCIAFPPDGQEQEIIVAYPSSEGSNATTVFYRFPYPADPACPGPNCPIRQWQPRAGWEVSRRQGNIDLSINGGGTLKAEWNDKYPYKAVSFYDPVRKRWDAPVLIKKHP